MRHRFISSRLAATLLLLTACDGGSTDDAGLDASAPDGGPVLEMSQLFGGCSEDWQCPGEGAICRTAAEGYPSGFCTLPCEDRTPCDANGVYHHCVRLEGETQSYCERRCLNGIDCGRTAYTCAGELPPSGGICISACSADEQCGDGTSCDRYTGQCTADPVPTIGSVTGETCADAEACRSGQCIAEVNDTGVPTGWVGGYCVANCILPSGYNSSDFFAGDALPSGTCAGNAVCLPASGTQNQRDLGTCYTQCMGDGDCRPGYGCKKQFDLASGGVSSYSNGICIPQACTSGSCPSGYECVTVTGADGSPRPVCGPL